MERDKGQSDQKPEGMGAPSSLPDKKSWEEPKLAFVEPKLIKHGSLEKVTRDPNGFFGCFSP